MSENKRWLIFSIIKEYSYKFSMYGNEVFSTTHWHKFHKFAFDFDIFICSNIANEEYRYGNPIKDLNDYLMNPSHSLLGVCLTIEAKNELDARTKGKTFTESFINVLSVSSKIGFEIVSNQIFVISLSKNDFDADNLHFETKYGKDAITFIFKTHTETHYFNWRISCHKDDANLLPVTCVMPRTGLDVDASLIILDEFRGKSESCLRAFMKLNPADKQIFIISSKLFRQSILTEDIIISYLLLWMCLETISEQEYESLIDQVSMNEVLKVLEIKYKQEIPRIKSQLGNIHKKGNTRLLTEFVSRNSKYTYDEIKDVINELKILRGQIVHPRKKIEEKKMFESHKKLFDIVDSVLNTILVNGEIKVNLDA